MAVSGDGSTESLTIGSRKSDLALWQAYEVLRLLRAAAPGAAFTLRTELASGDVALDAPLAALAAGCPGVFTKELEVALLARAVDVAVHSLKDMPTALPAGLALVGVTARDDARDAVVLSQRALERGARALADLPAGAVVGTSSLRREAYLRRAHPALAPALVRGNLNTRLRKLDAPDGGFDALLLAGAGLARLGWGARATALLDADDAPYGVGQGALGLEAREGDARARDLALAVTHAPTALCVLAERAFLRAMQGGCQVPLGVDCALEGGAAARRGAARGAEAAADGDGDGDGDDAGGARTLTLTGTVSSLDGASTVTATARAAVELPRGAARRVVNVWGLEAARAAAEAGAAEPAAPLPAGARWARVGVTREEWDALAEAGGALGAALAKRIIAAGGDALMGAARGEPRPITYGAAEAPLDRGGDAPASAAPA